MKISYSNLSCPHCGSKKFDLVDDDIFLCEYCNEKFNFSLEEIDFAAENKIFREELKAKFEEKINELNNEKKKYHTNLLYYKKLAYPKLLTIISAILLTLSTLVFFASLFPDNIPLSVAFCFICNIISLILFVLVKIYGKTKYNKYRSYISFCAEKIVDYDDKINLYVNLISKIVK